MSLVASLLSEAFVAPTEPPDMKLCVPVCHPAASCQSRTWKESNNIKQRLNWLLEDATSLHRASGAGYICHLCQRAVEDRMGCARESGIRKQPVAARTSQNAPKPAPPNSKPKGTQHGQSRALTPFQPLPNPFSTLSLPRARQEMHQARLELSERAKSSSGLRLKEWATWG